MRTLKLILVLILPCALDAQELTGFWTGTLINDSTKKEQHYELALSEYKGKVTGYSYTTFISNDTFYYSVKRMKATRKDSIWIVEDDYIEVHNFPEKPAKGVRQINTFRLNKQDSSWSLDGKWETTQTKRYYSLSGSMAMSEEKDYTISHLLPHLEELGLAENVPFYQEEKKAKREALAGKPIQVREVNTKTSSAASAPVKAIIVPTKSDTVARSVAKQSAKVNIPIYEKPVVVEPNAEPVIVKNEVVKPPVQEKKIINEQPRQRQETAIQKTAPPVVKTETPAVVKQEIKVEPKPALETPKPVLETPKPVIVAAVPPAKVAARKNETIQQLTFSSDSLMLTLYDNGVVDGDTVSVFLNGQNILDKQKLKEAATKKTIYISPETDSLELVLYAENLGTLPPNTGLLIIRDGVDTYQVRFSADMQKNAAIVFRRKK